MYTHIHFLAIFSPMCYHESGRNIWIYFNIVAKRVGTRFANSSLVCTAAADPQSWRSSGCWHQPFFPNSLVYSAVGKGWPIAQQTPPTVVSLSYTILSVLVDHVNMEKTLIAEFRPYQVIIVGTIVTTSIREICLGHSSSTMAKPPGCTPFSRLLTANA